MGTREAYCIDWTKEGGIAIPQTNGTDNTDKQALPRAPPALPRGYLP